MLSDPDHLKSKSINALYSHLLQRQDEGLAPFIVLNPGPHHERSVNKLDRGKGKARMEYDDSSDGEEKNGGDKEGRGKEEEEDKDKDEGEG